MSDANLTLDEVMFRAACLRAKEAGEFANNDQWAVLYAFDSAEKLEAKVKALRDSRHEAMEIYAGMEGFIPETAPEAYCLLIINKMYEALLQDKRGK